MNRLWLTFVLIGSILSSPLVRMAPPCADRPAACCGCESGKVMMKGACCCSGTENSRPVSSAPTSRVESGPDWVALPVSITPMTTVAPTSPAAPEERLALPASAETPLYLRNRAFLI